MSAPPNRGNFQSGQDSWCGNHATEAAPLRSAAPPRDAQPPPPPPRRPPLLALPRHQLEGPCHGSRCRRPPAPPLSAAVASDYFSTGTDATQVNLSHNDQRQIRTARQQRRAEGGAAVAHGCARRAPALRQRVVRHHRRQVRQPRRRLRQTAVSLRRRARIAAGTSTQSTRTNDSPPAPRRAAGRRCPRHPSPAPPSAGASRRALPPAPAPSPSKPRPSAQGVVVGMVVSRCDSRCCWAGCVTL
eukprot:COSAG01_NODE_1853_length_9060_cov_13.741576_8_plen_244_part_00